MLNSNREITSVVESSEFTGGDGSLVEGASFRLLGCWLFLGFVERDSFTTEAFTFLQDCYKDIELIQQVRY